MKNYYKKISFTYNFQNFFEDNKFQQEFTDNKLIELLKLAKQYDNNIYSDNIYYKLIHFHFICTKKKIKENHLKLIFILLKESKIYLNLVIFSIMINIYKKHLNFLIMVYKYFSYPYLKF